MRPFGYDSAYIAYGWPVTNAQAINDYRRSDKQDPDLRPQGELREVDVLAFYDQRQKDWNTSVISADFYHGDAVGTEASEDVARELFRLTAAPTNLVGNERTKKVDVWLNCHDGIRAIRGVDLDPPSLTKAFRGHRSDIQRDQLERLRAGQRHLFDGYLYSQRNELADFLQRGVSKATWLAPDSWGCNDRAEAFSRVALGLLAARILEDKGALGGDRGQSYDPRHLLSAAKGAFDSFFDTVTDLDLPVLDQGLGVGCVDEMLDCLLSHLTGPITFRLVTHEMLGDLYERALVAEERKAKGETYVRLRGVHYTPHSISRLILDRIPLEDIPPRERVVCDFACGSGSFLLAATERLADLYDGREPGTDEDIVPHLRKSVLGNDLDPVAILLTELSYQLAYLDQAAGTGDIPYPSLKGSHDALEMDIDSLFGVTPSVVVGNPPFDGPKPASCFLEKALRVLTARKSEVPGYLGMVMPKAFLRGTREQRRARERLLGEAELLEIWELPEQAVGLGAEHPTCIVIAKVDPQGPQERKWIRVLQTFSRKRESIERLRDSGQSTWAYAWDRPATHWSPNLPPRGEGLGGQPLAASPLDSIWSECSSRSIFTSEICDAVWGFNHTRAKGRPVPEFSAQPQKDCVPFVRRQSALRPYFLTDSDWKSSHGSGQDAYWKKGTGHGPYPSNWPLFESSKILVTASGNRNVVSQLCAALDFRAYYPGKNFLALALTDDWCPRMEKAYQRHFSVRSERALLRWICAILNSPIGHAWIASKAGPRALKGEDFTSLPLPTRYDPEIPKLVSSLRRMRRPPNLQAIPTWDAERGIGELIDSGGNCQAPSYWERICQINDLIRQSYGLTDTEFEQIKTFLRSMTDPWAVHDSRAAELGQNVILRVMRGQVVSIDGGRQKLEARFSWRSMGGKVAIKIPLPHFMPGWALEEGREFKCAAPVGCTVKDVTDNPWLLRNFEPSRHRYLDVEQLEKMVGYSREQKSDG